jgi:cation diffusion facilitator CzcD-associated flavoprotein CzcO
MTQRDVDVLVVGAGLGGVAAAITLKREGIEDFVILDKGDEIGGTWRDNRYPGVACDVPSAFYSYSFAPNPDWSRVFAPGDEIHRYVLRVATEHDVRRHIVFGTELLGATWDDDARHWIIETDHDNYTARVVIFATGFLEDRNIPSIPGIDTFTGRIFHSSCWPEGYTGAGERVAVVGTGASAIQITPELARTARAVTIFQRTPAWIYPKPDWHHTRIERFLMRRFPVLQRAVRGAIYGGLEIVLTSMFHPGLARFFEVPARLHIRLAVSDRRLRRALTPNYRLGCKRVLLSTEFYRSLGKPNVQLVPHAVTGVGVRDVTAADGSTHPVDTIVLSTGFKYVDAPIFDRIRRRDGRTVAQAWDGVPRAYMATTLSGCPNAFMLWGPNSGTASGIQLIESQLRYVAGALRAMRTHGLDVIEVAETQENEWKAQADRKLAPSVMNSGGCASYYLDRRGGNAALWPGSMTSLWRTLGTFDLAPYDVLGQPSEEHIPAIASDA